LVESGHGLVYGAIYGSTARVGLGRFFSFLIYTQSVGLLGRVTSMSQGRYLYTEQRKHRLNAHRHPCLQWDSNPRCQRLSERRQFMPRSHCDREVLPQLNLCVLDRVGSRLDGLISCMAKCLCLSVTQGNRGTGGKVPLILNLCTRLFMNGEPCYFSAFP
jgi:hypothetical protein